MKPIEEPGIFSKDSGAMLLIASLLKHSMHLSEAKINACLEAIADIASDHRYLAETLRAAAEKSIVVPKPKKQRRLKDQPLVLDKGALCLESGFVSGMRDKVKAKESVAKKKKIVYQAKRAAAKQRKTALQAKKAAAEKKKIESEAKKAAAVKKKAATEAKRAAVQAVKAAVAEAKTSKPKVPRVKTSTVKPIASKKNKNNDKNS